MNERSPSEGVPPPEMPVAEVEPTRRISWAWSLPLLALVFAVFLGWKSWAERGVSLSVRFEQGWGIQPGAAVRYRGISVGEVARVTLDDEFEDVVVGVRLQRHAGYLARAGSRFWIVRPQASLSGIGGLDTIVGKRYLEVLPGPEAGPTRTDFVGLESAPLLERIEPGGREIVLRARKRFGILPGAPIYYRQIQVGLVLLVGLSSDATAVEMRAYIHPPYVQLVRANTRFWDVSGVSIDLALQGLRVELETLRSLVAGGIAMATPYDAGDPVGTGHVFQLHEDFQDEWLKWQPALPVGSSLLPEGLAPPQPLRASLSWRSGRILGGARERQGCVLQVADGLLGPEDLLRSPEGAKEGSVRLELAGERLGLESEPVWAEGGLALYPLRLPEIPVWPALRSRRPEEPEDCLVWADPSGAPMAVSVARLEPGEASWRVDEALSFDERWHGACVLARADGALIGILLLDGAEARVVPVPGG